MDDTRPSRRAWVALAVVLLILGLLGHLSAAHAIGGSYVAYRDHIFGFVIGLVVFGGVAAALGWRFWKRRPDITLLIVGVAQALFGFAVYLARFHIG
jgi:cell division protein FtsW (lipid II flippase)